MIPKTNFKFCRTCKFFKQNFEHVRYQGLCYAWNQKNGLSDEYLVSEEIYHNQELPSDCIYPLEQLLSWE